LGVCCPVFDAGPDLHDFADTAALIAHLDLVISVDSAVCHLAGALGKPTWTLLDFAAEWRWLQVRDDTPWYPTMRLFRQRQRRNWDDVVAEVRTALFQRQSTPPSGI
jgi:ADP-heptose:LPS heptosyltransferase